MGAITFRRTCCNSFAEYIGKAAGVTLVTLAVTGSASYLVFGHRLLRFLGLVDPLKNESVFDQETVAMAFSYCLVMYSK